MGLKNGFIFSQQWCRKHSDPLTQVEIAVLPSPILKFVSNIRNHVKVLVMRKVDYWIIGVINM